MSIPTFPPQDQDGPVMGTISRRGPFLGTMTDDGPILSSMDRHFVGGAGSRAPVRRSVSGPVIGARGPVIGGAPARGPVPGI